MTLLMTVVCAVLNGLRSLKSSFDPGSEQTKPATVQTTVPSPCRMKRTVLKRGTLVMAHEVGIPTGNQMVMCTAVDKAGI